MLRDETGSGGLREARSHLCSIRVERAAGDGARVNPRRNMRRGFTRGTPLPPTYACRTRRRPRSQRGATNPGAEVHAAHHHLRYAHVERAAGY